MNPKSKKFQPGRLSRLFVPLLLALLTLGLVGIIVVIVLSLFLAAP